MLRGYGTQFSVKPRGGDAAATARLVLQVAVSWCADHAGEGFVDELGKATTKGDVTLKSEFRAVPGASWGLVEYKHPDPADPERVLLTRARIAQAATAIELQVEVLVGHRTRRVAPVVASANQPGFVIDIVRHFECFVGPAVVDELASTIEANAVRHWVEAVVLDPNRALPAILVTPEVNGAFPVDPDVLAERTVAIANVYLLADPNDTYALTGVVGKMRSCFHGGVRTYYPRMTLNDDPLRHPLYLGTKLRASPDPVGRIVGDLYALGSATIQDTDVFLEAQRIVREHLTKTITATHDASKLQALVVEKDAERAARDETIAALRQELEDTKRAFGRYARNLQGDQRGGSVVGAALPAEDLAPPKNVGEILARMAPKLTHVSVLPSAYKASDSYGRKYHDQVAAALECLNDLGAARDAGDGKLGMGVAEWMTKWQATHPKRPLPEFKAKESQTTWATASLRKQRTFNVDGAPVAMQMHLDAGASDWGDCVQLFFEFGDVVGKPGILLGYVGPHLDLSNAPS